MLLALHGRVVTDINTLERQIEGIEKMTSNPGKMYKAIQNIYKKEKVLLELDTGNGKTSQQMNP